MLRTRTATLALVAGLALSLGACTDGSGDQDGRDGDGSAPLASIESLTGEQTAVTFDASFVAGLAGLGVTPGTVGEANLDLQAGRITFPITGGSLTYYDPSSGVEPFVQGEVQHAGSGLALIAEERSVLLSDFVVDPEESVLTGTVTVDGEVLAEAAPLLFLDGRTLEPLRTDAERGEAVLEGTTVSLTAEAAQALNGAFGTDALAEYFPVGVAEIVLALPES